jgi:amidase
MGTHAHHSVRGGGRLAVAAIIAAAAACSAPAPEPATRPAGYDVEEKSIRTLQADLAAGHVTSEGLVAAYLERIARLDRSGPTLRSVLSTNPNAPADARALDEERAAGRVRGLLHGIPILVKDNIETRDPMATTAGSLALAANVTNRDAPAIARLRAAGAIILGKTNLSEWANIRSSQSTSGWSAVGGLTRNPYALDRNPCGSSSGSGAAIAASLAAAAIGTETDGSVTCPSSVNGLVGLKPTVGLIPRTHIVPISHSQDTAGPMTRTVDDTAILLAVMAGTDASDAATRDADTHKADYAAALAPEALHGARLVVLRFLAGFHRGTDAMFDRAIATMKSAGAEIVEVADLPGRERIGAAELNILLTELKAGLNAYLSTTPPAVKTRTLADVIAFNHATPAETPYFGQELFEKAEATKGLADPAYRAAASNAKRLAGPLGIDRLLREHKAAALLAPTVGPAWMTDLATGDHFLGGATELPAVAGYPHITVPMGEVMGLPVGVSLIGGAWSEARLIGLAYGFEQRAKARTPPKYLVSLAEPSR